MCAGSSVDSGNIRFAMLVGTGLAFCNFLLTSNFDIIDLVLPPLSEHGRRQLLEQSELPGGELPSGAVQRALDQDRTLQSLCDGTLGIPGAIKVLGAAVTAHFNNGHELGRYALILKHLHAQGPCQSFLAMLSACSWAAFVQLYPSALAGASVRQDHLSLCMARARQAQTRSAAASAAAQACLQRSGIRNENSTCLVSIYTAFSVTKQRLCCVQALHPPVADTVGSC